MSEYKYPPGYTPMTDEELSRIWMLETGGLIESHRAIEQAVLARLNTDAERDALVDALEDMLNGWKYIRATHGDLYGVGWNRAQEKAESALAKAKGRAA